MALTTDTFYGLNIAWGLGANFSASNAVGLFQSAEHDSKLDEWEGRDQRGNVVSWAGYNPMETATFEYYVSDASTASGSAVPTFNTNVPQQGSKITITSGFPINGASWIVQDSLIRATNTEAVKVTIKAVRYPNIT